MKNNTDMSVLKLPHLPPILFAKKLLKKDGNVADVLIEFDEYPTLPMLVEAAAQSSAAFRKSEDESAFLASIKNVELLVEPKSTTLISQIIDEHTLGNFRYVSFKIFESDDKLIAKGSFVLIVH